MKSWLLAGLFVFFLVLKSRAQDDALLAGFSGQQIDDYVHLVFTVKGGITCLGTEVQRSSDNQLFETIGILPGVCGSSSTDETYTFDDLNPLKNQVNYYRIDFGNYGLSQSFAVHVIDFGSRLVVAPNPVDDAALIYFPNAEDQVVTVWLTDAAGKRFSETESRANQVRFSRGTMAAGWFMAVVLYPSGQILSTPVFLR